MSASHQSVLNRRVFNSTMLTIIFALVIAVVLYLYGKKNYKYWHQRGIKHDKPIPFLGNNARNFFMKKSITEMLVEMYWKYPKEKVVGYYRAFRPELVIRDPEIAKRVLTTDFLHFYPRGLNPHKRHIEPMFRNLFFADGDLWRLLRQRMTPAFTSGKLKAMFPLIVERAVKLQKRVLNGAADGRIMDARDMMARYTTDFIGACGFGLETDSLNDENSSFRKLGAKIFTITPKQVIITMLKLMFPELFKYLKVSDVESDIVILVNQILKARNYQPSGRHDFIDLLLECKAKGVIVGESIERFKADGSPEVATLELDDILMAAQVFVFFAAGFETSSSATSFTLHQLAYNPDKQKKAQEEIDRVLAKHDNKLSYDSIKEMTYLHCCFKEGMRMFPSLGYLIRQCVGKYTFPEIDLTIDEGVQIFIPLQAMQNDPQYFENPDQYRPERFLPEEYDTINNKYIYMPFGIGPRACIGERLGLMQSIAGLAAVLSSSTVEPAVTTIRYPKIDPKNGIVQSVQGGLPLMFRARKSAVH